MLLATVERRYSVAERVMHDADAAGVQDASVRESNPFANPTVQRMGANWFTLSRLGIDKPSTRVPPITQQRHVRAPNPMQRIGPGVDAGTPPMSLR